MPTITLPKSDGLIPIRPANDIDELELGETANFIMAFGHNGSIDVTVFVHRDMVLKIFNTDGVEQDVKVNDLNRTFLLTGPGFIIGKISNPKQVNGNLPLAVSEIKGRTDAGIHSDEFYIAPV